MTKKEFERQINQLIPEPDLETTAVLFAFGQELGEEDESNNVQALLNSLKFIERHFDKHTLQGVYEIIQNDTAVLPSEMVAAALHLRNGCTPQQAAQLADAGRLMCFYAPQDADELSPLAVCAVVEHGESQTFHTTQFGMFDPETALRSARDYARNRQTSVTNALRFLTVHMNADPDGAGKILTSGHDNMTKLLADAFDRCAITAARLTFDADREQVSVEYNPLWLELRQQLEPAQAGIGLTM